MTQDEFHKMIPEWISKDRDSWNHITLMAYFCHKYKDSNGVRFRLVRWKNDPGKGKESRDFATLFKIFAPENYNDLSSLEKRPIKIEIVNKIYNYINWMFDFKFKRGEQSVTGTRIFILPAMINEFERMYNKYLTKESNEQKMTNIISWCSNNIPALLNSHQLEEVDDVRMIKRYAETYSLDENAVEVILVNKAIDMGLINE